MKKFWRYLCFLVLLFLLYLMYAYATGFKLEKNVFKAVREIFHKNPNKQKANPIVQMVHLDLKGAPPKMSYLMDRVPKLKSVGVNGLLVEYEDMFPYEGRLKNIPSSLPYSKAEISQFLSLCDEHNIEVIPLIQTFGHMEFVLKVPEFRYLREDLRDPPSICPSDSSSVDLIEEMLKQVLALHSKSKRIHIGCDEVYTMNGCSRCLEKRKSKTELFFNHVRKVATFIRERYNNKITPLIWDDMIRTVPDKEILESNLPNLVDIVIWDYVPFLKESIRGPIWNKYKDVFKRIWVASAFKGADGSKAMLPVMEKRHENHKSWLQFIEEAHSDSIVGLISTGWSRYDHFDSLCELLPASIPSLILNLLQTTATFNSSRDVVSEYNSILKCPQLSIQDVYDLSNVEKCSFPESAMVFGIWQLEQLQRQTDLLYDDLFKKFGWISENNSKINRNSVGIKMVKDEFAAKYFDATYSQFLTVYDVLESQMKLYYQENTIKEWIETNLEPYWNKLRLLKTIQNKVEGVNGSS